MSGVLATYMEMTAGPSGPACAAPSEDAQIARGPIGRDGYLALYAGVSEGEWDRRPRMSAEAVDRFLVSPGTDIYVLRCAGRDVGLCEFEGVGQDEIELATFGLIPEARGRGLGPYLLDHALRSVWMQAPRRIWLRTDSGDHPKAIPTYQCAGFRIFKQAVE